MVVDGYVAVVKAGSADAPLPCRSVPLAPAAVAPNGAAVPSPINTPCSVRGPSSLPEPVSVKGDT